MSEAGFQKRLLERKYEALTSVLFLESEKVSENEKLVFDLSMRVQAVEIGEKNYELREASEDAVRQYKNGVLDGLSMGPSGKPQRLKNIADLDSALLSKCLYDSDNKRVSLDVIRSWPSRIVTELTKRVKIMSEMDEDDAAVKESAGNGEDDTRLTF